MDEGQTVFEQLTLSYSKKWSFTALKVHSQVLDYPLFLKLSQPSG